MKICSLLKWGLKGNLIFYLKQNGRIQTEVTFVNVTEDEECLLPQSSQGMLWKSLKTNSSIQFY